MSARSVVVDFAAQALLEPTKLCGQVALVRR
jgi:hypothetical protein